jgi:hypothetical protein
MVTGPMPRKPKATRPKAKTAGASMMPRGGSTAGDVQRRYAPPMRPMITRPSQKAEKLPAMRPDSTFSDAPPSRDAVTTSRTWRTRSR